MRRNRSGIALALIVGAPLCFCAIAAAQDMVAEGEQVYDEHCASCHGEKLRSTGAMPDLKELGADARARFDQVVLNGKGQMPPWQGVIAPNQLDQLWAYIRSRARN